MTRTTCMPNYLRNEVVLVRYPFSDLTNFKVRPGVVINGPHTSDDLSKTKSLQFGEFVLKDWQRAGLNIETAAKLGVFTIHKKLVLKSLGSLNAVDAGRLDESLRDWLHLQ